MAQRRDYYEILGVGRDADATALKSAYRKLALQHHPDRNPEDPGAAERFKEASEAYAVLSDPDKRARYDRLGHAGLSGTPGFGAGGFDFSMFDLSDLLGEFFGFSGLSQGRGGRHGAEGSDLVYRLELTLKDAAFGATAPVEVEREERCGECTGSGAQKGTRPHACPSCRGTGQQRFSQGFLTVARPCGNCRGEGTVIDRPCRGCGGEGVVRASHKLEIKIPAGVETGTRLRLAAEGDAGRRGGPAGDLYVVLTVAEHEVFAREGEDLVVKLDLPFPTLVLGGEIGVPTLDGEEERLAIAPGTAAGTEARFSGLGVGRLGRRGRGDLVVRIGVRVPTKPTADEKELLKRYAEMTGAPVGGKGILGKAWKIFS
jgi:molecular chaperone DnaJ